MEESRRTAAFGSGLAATWGRPFRSPIRGPSACSRQAMARVGACLVPPLPIAYTWHLVLFAPAYDALGIYRPDPIIPFGFASMVIQGIAFSWAYPRRFPGRGSAILRRGLVYGLAFAILSWSFTTLAVAAKNIM